MSLQGDPGRERIFTSAAYGDLAADVPPVDLAPTDVDATPRHTSVLRPTMRPMHRTKMVRTQEWKFILNETEPPGLYRIAEVRPRERRDLAGSTGYARARRDLEKHLAAWWAW